MKPAVVGLGGDVHREEFLEQILEEAERAILDVDGRADEPGRRVLIEDGEPQGVAEFQVAIAELVDAFPSLQREIEMVADVLQRVGAHHAAAEIEARPHLVQLLWLTVEVFFRQYVTLESYEIECRGRDDEEALTPHELYSGYVRILKVLRNAIS